MSWAPERARFRAGARCLRLALAMGVLGSVHASTGALAQDFAPLGEVVRVPILLVPGWGDEASQLTPLRDRLVAAGWAPDTVASLTFRNPVGSNLQNAAEVGAAVEALRARTGAERVDVVAHSMGGLAVRAYLRDLGDRVPVRRAVFLGTPHRGTVTAALAWGGSAREMVPGSDFLDRLNREEPVFGSVDVLSIRTPLDLSVIPGSSAMLPGALNLEVCCPSHQGLLDDEETFNALRAFLLVGPSALALPDETIPLRTPTAQWLDGGP